MHKRLLGWTTIALLACSPGIDAANQAPAIKPVFGSTSFNIGVKHLPPAFGGHDVVRLFTALATKENARGQLEAVAEHKTRLSSAKTPLYGRIGLDSMLAFTDGADTGGAEYKAGERQAILRANVVACSDDRSGLKMRASSASKRQGTAPGTAQTVYSICVPASLLKPVLFGQDKIELGAPLEPSQAGEELRNLKFLYIGKLSYPYAQETPLPPTSGSQQDTGQINRYLFVDVAELWIYSVQTGKIFKKIKLTN